MRIGIVKGQGAISSRCRCKRPWSFKGSKRKNLQYIQLPHTPPPPKHCVDLLSSYIDIFRGLRTTYFSSHLCLALRMEAMQMCAVDGRPEPRVGSSVTLREVGFSQNALIEADSKEVRVQENQDGGVGRHTAPPRTTRTNRKSNSKEV